MNIVNRRFIIILVSIITLVIITALSAGVRGNLSWPERLVKDTSSFFQQLIYKPAIDVAGFFEDVSDLFNLYDENKSLKSALNQFAQVQANYEVLKKENERLRDMLNARSTLKSYRMIVAEVIARQQDSWYNIITIDKGERDGIRPNMAVSTSGGLIGVIDSVSYFSSNVRLLTDIERGSHISAMVLENEETFGIVESYDAERKEMIMRKVPLETKIEVGKKVVTSGLGGIFPKGILIGEITEVRAGEDGLTQMAYIKPSADLFRLNEVFVLDRLDENATHGEGNP